MKKKIILTDKAPTPIGQYNQAVQVENTLYVSGQIPIDPETGKIVADDIAKQTDQVMENIWAILNEADMDFSNVVKCSIFVKDITDFYIVDAAYEKFFHDDPPARETVEVAALPKGAKIEVSCIAVG